MGVHCWNVHITVISICKMNSNPPPKKKNEITLENYIKESTDKTKIFNYYTSHGVKNN